MTGQSFSNSRPWEVAAAGATLAARSAATCSSFFMYQQASDRCSSSFGQAVSACMLKACSCMILVGRCQILPCTT